MTIPEKISSLRTLMSERNIDAWIIPGTDPHQSEYLPKFWNEREWISGFTGSFGQIVITQSSAGLWTDSRYFIQGDSELKQTGIDLYKLRVEEEPTLLEFLQSELKQGDNLGFNPKLFSVNAVQNYTSALTPGGIQLNTTEDLISEIWTDRPPMSTEKVLSLSTDFSGQSVIEKLAVIRNGFNKQNDILLLTALDEIAWTFNIRGRDIDYNPLTVAWAVVSNDSASLFVDQQKIDASLRKSLQDNGVSIANYDAILSYLAERKDGDSICLDANKVNQELYQCIPTHCSIHTKDSPIALLKSKKNTIELNGIRNAMVKDGIALIRFLICLENIMHKDEKISEYEIGVLLKELRAAQDHFFGESFTTIAGYMSNGAIVHYSPSELESGQLKAEGIVLIDSGGQYFDGTTDITRTIRLGDVSEEIKSDFTNVLKGVIALSNVTFPKGTTGVQLDVLARHAMWQQKIDYGHGTGHGVGHFLNVHEGPQTMRKEGNMVPFEEGMLITIEPGIYKSNRHGIRTENMVAVSPAGESEFGRFLKFETLTLCPIDKSLIKSELLSPGEKKWLNDYHQKVYDRLSPFITESEKDWLKNKTTTLDD